MNSPDLELIYTGYRDKVMAYIRARVNSWADAEDLCEDVFEKIQRKLGDYDPQKAAVGTWVFTITRNTVIDFFRRSRPAEELDENIAAEEAVDEGLLNEETLHELAESLRSLPQECMDIIVMRYYDGKPLTEIATIMGLSYGAVKLRHQHALDLLRNRMKFPG